MYRFTRSVQAKNAAHVAPAVVFAADICAYVNKTYKVNMQFGRSEEHTSELQSQR